MTKRAAYTSHTKQTSNPRQHLLSPPDAVDRVRMRNTISRLVLHTRHMQSRAVRVCGEGRRLQAGAGRWRLRARLRQALTYPGGTGRVGGIHRANGGELMGTQVHVHVPLGRRCWLVLPCIYIYVINLLLLHVSLPFPSRRSDLKLRISNAYLSRNGN